MPDNRCVIIKSIIDTFDPHQRNERLVDGHNLLRQICRVSAIIRGPGNRPHAQHIERKADGQTPSCFHNPARDGGFFQRWFHATGLNIAPTEFFANPI